MMKSVKVALLVAASVGLATASPAQYGSGFGNDGLMFVKAVRERDGAKATQLLESQGPVIINAKDDKGDTGLLTAIRQHDDTWTLFLLQKGADGNLGNRAGETPLIAAARIGFTQAVEWLMSRKVKVDAANRMGETALIVATQQGQTAIVRRLLSAGANPDRADTAAGLTARDYATRNARARDILKLIESKKPKLAPAKP